MKAIVHPCYGKADVLRYEDVAVPQPGDREVLVEVRAVALNPLDWHYLTGTPYVMRLDSGLGRPRSDRLGVDFAGVVAAVGPGVTRFKPGDEVLGSRFGAFAEYAVVAEDRALVPKPSRLSFEQAAAVPVAAITALQGLRDKGRVKAGDKVLINGASGGVGTFAVQIAKALGAEVTGVCSTRNVELVRSLGADHVIDYKQDDFTRGDRRYDVIIDNVGNHPLRAVRRVLEPDGTYVMIGGPKDDRWLGPVLGFLKAPLMSLVSSQRFEVLLAGMNAADLGVLNSMIEAGQVTPVIDRTYALQDIPAAIDYLETQRARGKVVAARP
ncbi:MAG: NAD(P)-dependent alcohol dehydrogenase [Gammaproteobacteria bacterium]|nr:NAD(P)-dependent alcohol dehydrogenase [Gammaproteobacteria bacterium]